MDAYRAGPAVDTSEISPWASVQRPPTAYPRRAPEYAPVPRPWNGWETALAMAGAAHVAWALFGVAGLSWALDEKAATDAHGGAGWFAFGALLFQAPATLLAIPLAAALVAMAVRDSRAGRVLGFTAAAVTAVQVAYWVTVASMNTTGTC